MPTAPEGSNKLAKIAFVVATAAVPAGAFKFLDNHQVVWTIAGELLVFSTAFIVKVWDKLEAQWVDSVAKRVGPEVESLVTRYRARYRRCMYFQHRSFDVKGLNTQGAFSLELDQVFVELSLSPEAPHKVSADPLRKPPANTSAGAGERREIWEFLKSEPASNLAVLGPPGCGKSTLLKHVALALAGPRKRRPVNKTPVLLQLKDVAPAVQEKTPLTLADAVRNSLPATDRPPAGWIESELDGGRCVILLDGLDEVADPKIRQLVVRWVEDRMKEHGSNRFVVTSRPFGYLSNPLSGVTVLDVRPFTWPQVERFVQNWYRATETVRAGRFDRGVEMEAQRGASDLLRRWGLCLL